MTSKEIVRMIVSGDSECMIHFLQDHSSEPIELEWEPYTAIQRKKQANVLKLLMDDPRFVFDDIFVGRMFYFSTAITQRTVWEHPRMKDIRKGAECMSEYFYRRFPNPTWNQSAGIGQRFFQADNAIRYLRREDAKKQNQRLAFFLYPALHRFIHTSLQRQYQPEGVGFLRRRNEFLTPAAGHISTHG